MRKVKANKVTNVKKLSEELLPVNLPSATFWVSESDEIRKLTNLQSVTAEDRCSCLQIAGEETIKDGKTTYTNKLVVSAEECFTRLDDAMFFIESRRRETERQELRDKLTSRYHNRTDVARRLLNYDQDVFYVLQNAELLPTGVDSASGLTLSFLRDRIVGGEIQGEIAEHIVDTHLPALVR